MSNIPADLFDPIDPDVAWAAVLRRDRSFDGRFVTAVLTTKIYCRPSCPARHPGRAKVRFFSNGLAAHAEGFRACLRCLPDSVGRDEEAIALACRLLEQDEPPRLQALAQEVGYAPHHFARIFKRATGLTPAAWTRSRRMERARQALGESSRVTDAIYQSGFSGPSRFYAEVEGQLGMSVRSWREGGAGETIRWAVVPCALGSMLVAATDIGICRVSFDEDEATLKRLFPKASIVPGGEPMEALVGQVVNAVSMPGQVYALPLDVRGTAFQMAVWQALRAIPAGETRSYGEIAAQIGRAGATRAVGTACGDNHVAVLIPCHRVLRSDGSLGGYAYGLDRKRALLHAEAALHKAVGINIDGDPD